MSQILSLHNETEVLLLLHTILTRGGYEHIYTTSNDEALSILHQAPVALLIQNVMRPTIDGCDFYQSLKKDEMLTEIPILIVTTVHAELLKREAKLLIADLYPHAYLSMPFSPHKLLQVVKSLLEQTPESSGKVSVLCR